MLQCIVVTPEQTVYEQKADFVAMMLYDGEIGIGPDHTPLIGRLGFGEMRVRQGNKTESFYIEGGFVEVMDDVVSVLTHRAVPAAEVDEAVAREQLANIEKQPAKTPEAVAVRDRVMAQSRAQIRIAQKAR
jgi:F-type H+-transporting ATPase subunit epsilon